MCMVYPILIISVSKHLDFFVNVNSFRMVGMHKIIVLSLINVEYFVRA